MARDQIALQKQHQYSSDDPRLQQVLKDLEEAAATAFRKTQLQKQETLEVVGPLQSDRTVQFGEFVLVSAPSGGVTITLPKGTRDDAGKAVIVKTTGGTNTTLVRAAGDQQIDGVGSWGLSTAYESVRLYWSGEEWWRF